MCIRDSLGLGSDEPFAAVEGDAVTLAPTDDWAITEASDDLRLLEIRLPS